MPLLNISELENAIERTKLQQENLFLSSFTTAEIQTLEYVYNWQITIYQDALNRLKSVNNIEVFGSEIVKG